MANETPAPLPAAEPTTLDAVKGALGIDLDDSADDADLTQVVAAASRVVRGLPVAGQARGLADWPSDLKRGATLLAAGMAPRRKKPNGDRKFTTDDPEVQLLLEMGPYARPRLG